MSEPVAPKPRSRNRRSRRRPRTPTPRLQGASSLVRCEGRLFGGVDFSGDMRDPKDATWLCVLELAGEKLRVALLEPTGRQGLEAQLKDAEACLLKVEAIGLDFPFSLPLPFIRERLGGVSDNSGWWDVARHFENLSRPAYLKSLAEFSSRHGEVKRLTDERAGAFSPFHRVNPDMGPMTFHGIRMIAKERSRHALRPFERAKGRLLLEVYPGGFLRLAGLRSTRTRKGRNAAILELLEGLPELPIALDEKARTRCLSHRDALDAVTAARCAAGAVLSGETDRSPDELAPGHGIEVKLEGWIYGLPASPGADAVPSGGSTGDAPESPPGS